MTNELTNSSPANLAAAYQEQLEQAMSVVVPMLGLESEAMQTELSTYVHQRVDELSPTSDTESVSLGQGGTERYINRDVEMAPGIFYVRPFKLDDTAAYEASIPYIAEAFSVLSDLEDAKRSYITAVLRGVNLGQAVYFESYEGSPSRHAKITDLLVDDNQEGLSISSFGDAAICLQRAAVAHNTLHIFGISSRLEVGKLSHTSDQGEEISEAHAFLTIIGSDGTKYIFDPSNPIKHVNEVGQTVYIEPAIYELNPDEEGRQMVSLAEYTIDGGVTKQTGSKTITYTLAYREGK